MFSIWFQIIIINGHCGPAIKWEFGCLMPFAYDDDLCCGQTLALDATQMHFCCSIYGAWWDCENVAAYNLVVMACTHANAFGPFCPAHCPASLPPEFHSSYKYFIFFPFLLLSCEWINRFFVGAVQRDSLHYVNFSIFNWMHNAHSPARWSSMTRHNL